MNGQFKASGEEGASLIGVLIALGMLGFFISVAFSGLGAARRSTEELLIDAEFNDLRQSFAGYSLCAHSCLEVKQKLKPTVGKWRIAMRCDERSLRIYARLLQPQRNSEAARAKYSKWKPTGYGPGGASCEYSSPGSRRMSSRSAQCPDGLRIIGVNFANGTVVCR